MKIPIYQVDAFTSKVFSGNPAAVCLLDEWQDDFKLQSIAEENNLSETAFIVHTPNGFDIRWFTPTTEVALCGHATLASAFVIFNLLGWTQNKINFQTRKSGLLQVTKQDTLLEMNFPSKSVYNISPPQGLKEALHAQPQEIWGSEEDLLIVLENEEAVLDVQPDFNALSKITCRGIIITAKGKTCDFVSRFFAPRFGIPEDPVTGSAHCVLIPYWAKILKKNSLHAFQVSKRGGELFCLHSGERVKISGNAALYMEGTIKI